MVKFNNKSDLGYSSARDKLRQFEQDATSVVAARFCMWDSILWIGLMCCRCVCAELMLAWVQCDHKTNLSLP